jgi:His-Xaa-Ser system protein HxsD
MSNGKRAFILSGDRIELTLDALIYSPTAVQKAGYRLAKRCSLVIDCLVENELRGSLLLPPDTTEIQARGVAADFFRELSDQQLRERVQEETKGIRELVLAHAFSKTDLIDRQ